MKRLLFLFLALAGMHAHAQAPPALTVDTGRVAFNGGSLFYEIQQTRKDAPPLLFVHAGFQDRSMWAPQAAFFRNDYRVITVDLPGHGATVDGPQRPNADSILLALMDGLSIPKAAIVSLSFGSAISLEFASRHPERVEKLVMAGPGMEGWNEPDSLLPSTLEAFGSMMAALEARDTVKAARGFVQNWYLGPARKPAALTPSLYQYGFNTTLGNMRRHRVSGWPVFAEPTTMHRVAALQIPVLLIIGDKDMPEVARVGNWLQRTLPHARLLTYRNAAHMVNLEYPALFNKDVQQFLRN